MLRTTKWGGMIFVLAGAVRSIRSVTENRSKMTKLIHKEELNWKGVLHDLELYESDSVGDLDPVKQVQAVSFIDNNNVVIYKHVDGYYGLPGGSVEENESFEEALKREIREEIACEV